MLVRCPHQGGPLGEGSIENGLLRCPWHGWDFHPTTGKAPGGFDDGVDTFPVEVREDGVYVGFPAEGPHRRTVSDLMADTMVAWGVRWVWGMVGHSNLGLADALRRQEEAGGLTYIGIRHEGAASFAASAYGKLTGRPAACFSIAGPGATNLLTGLWDANVDRSPVLALTGQVDTQVLGPGAFQEIDLMAAYGKVAQWSQTVLPSSRHAELVNLACKSAILNRGVSHLVFPDEVQRIEVGDEVTPGNPQGRLTRRDITPPEASLQGAADLLRQATRPVIIVGHGARFDMDAIVALAETLACPVITTFKGKGQISDHTGITPKKPIIQVDFDPMALGKFHPVQVPVWGEIGVTVRLFREEMVGGGEWVDQREEIAERWQIWRDEKGRREEEERGKGVSSAALFAAMTRQVPEDAILCVDVGNNTHVLLNNDELGKISKEQRSGQWPVWQTGLRNPDFAAYAELCGAFGIRVTNRDELDGALARALSHHGPSLVEIVGEPGQESVPRDVST